MYFYSTKCHYAINFMHHERDKKTMDMYNYRVHKLLYIISFTASI
jgi:hypothetical protein